MLAALAHPDRLAIILAALAYYLFGAAWFTPFFGKAWDHSIGYERSKATKFGLDYYLVPLVNALVLSFALDLILTAVSPSSFGEVLLVGVVIGLGITAISINNALTPHTPHPYLFGVVTGGYHFIGILFVAAIIGAFLA